MPVITFESPNMGGKTLSKEQKKELITEFTNSAAKVTGVPERAFYVYIKENDTENIGVGGTLLSDQKKG